LLGIRLEVDRLRVEPLIPPGWKHFDVRYRHRDTVYDIHVRILGGGRTVSRVVCDGVDEPSRTILLRDDRKEHHVEVDVGGPPATSVASARRDVVT
jgi:cellobiose phosphorylase